MATHLALWGLRPLTLGSLTRLRPRTQEWKCPSPTDSLHRWARGCKGWVGDLSKVTEKASGRPGTQTKPPRP